MKNIIPLFIVLFSSIISGVADHTTADIFFKLKKAITKDDYVQVITAMEEGSFAQQTGTEGRDAYLGEIEKHVKLLLFDPETDSLKAALGYKRVVAIDFECYERVVEIANDCNDIDLKSLAIKSLAFND